MRTTVDLEPSILERIRKEAHRRGISFKDMLTLVLRRGLESRPESAKRFRTPTFAMGEPQPGVRLEKALRVAEELHDDVAATSLRARR